MRNYEQGMLIVLAPIIIILFYFWSLLFSIFIENMSKEIVKYVGEVGNFIFWYVVFCILFTILIYNTIIVSKERRYY